MSRRLLTANEMSRRGKLGGKARAKSLMARKRHAIARQAAQSRWLFPAARAADDLRQLGLTVAEAAKRMGLNRETLGRVLRGEQPSVETVRKFLALGVDRRSYMRFVERPVVILRCPGCGSPKKIDRRQLKRYQRFRKTPLCPRCHWRRRGQEGLRRVEAERVEKIQQSPSRRPGDDPVDLLYREKARKEAFEWPLSNVSAANQAKNRAGFQSYAKAPERSDEFRMSHSRARVLQAAALEHPPARRRGTTTTWRQRGALWRRAPDFRYEFHLCPWCGLIKYRDFWHRPCWDAFLNWKKKGQHTEVVDGLQRYTLLDWLGHRLLLELTESPSKPGAFTVTRLEASRQGPPQDLLRNYKLLIGRRQGQSLKGLAAQAHLGESTVVEAINGFVQHLPGSWDLVFTPTRTGKHTRRRKRTGTRYTSPGGNVTREDLVPLSGRTDKKFRRPGKKPRRPGKKRRGVLKPRLELLELCESGARDPLVAWLSDHGMKSVETLHKLTGVTRDRIRGIVAQRLNKASAALRQEIEMRIKDGVPMLSYRDGVPFLLSQGLARDEAFQLIKDRDGQLWCIKTFTDLQGKPAVLLPTRNAEGEPWPTPSWLDNWAEQQRERARNASSAAWTRVSHEERRAIARRGVLTRQAAPAANESDQGSSKAV